MYIQKFYLCLPHTPSSDLAFMANVQFRCKAWHIMELLRVGSQRPR